MCGINGCIQFDGRMEANEMRLLVHKMNEQITYRGPDDEGLYADMRCSLGMRRLSIIDLEGGSQPIWNAQRSMLIVFNGELYNYRELKKRILSAGVEFSTNSDTEVVLLGYELYGLDVLKMLEGMFAFVIYDIRLCKWIIVRDRFGEKPLYYHLSSERMLIASELQSIIGTGLVDREIDNVALSQYLQLTYIPAPLSIIKGVRKLSPATYMVVENNGSTEVGTYWSLPLLSECHPAPSYSDSRRELKDALFSSVEQRMVSDVPIGAFLSGGFDSSIVVSIMSQLSQERVRTFTVAFNEKGYDESNLASIVAKRNGTEHTVLHLDEDEMKSDLPRLLASMGEPFADPSLVGVYAVSKKAREHVKVVLTGDGGDELFAGYNKYLMPLYGRAYRRIPSVLRKNVLERSTSLLPSKSQAVQKAKKLFGACELVGVEQARYLMSLGFKTDELSRLAPNLDTEVLGFVYEQFDYLQKADAQTRTQYVDLKTVLEGDMLAKVDRGSMLASLETRIPMLGAKVVELAFRLPTEYKIKGRQRKIILKDAFADMLPKELYRAPKHGFDVPMGDWLEGSLQPQLLAYADRDYLREQGLFDVTAVWTLINEHMSHKINRFRALWTFYVFQSWYQRTMSEFSHA